MASDSSESALAAEGPSFRGLEHKLQESIFAKFFMNLALSSTSLGP